MVFIGQGVEDALYLVVVGGFVDAENIVGVDCCLSEPEHRLEHRESLEGCFITQAET